MRSLIYISLILAMALSITPLPDWIADYRPDWVVLVVIWASIHHCDKFNVGSAWVVGILLDLLNATVLGQYSLAYTIISYLAIRLNQQFKIFSVLQKILTILLLLIVFRMMLFWIFSISGDSIKLEHYWHPLLSSVIIWPWMNAVLREINKKLSQNKKK